MALHGGVPERLEVHPNVWAGFSLVRQGPGVALVGSHAEVAERIGEFHDHGAQHLVLSAQPHLEEAYHVGEGLMPEPRRRGLLAGQGDDPAADKAAEERVPA